VGRSPRSNEVLILKLDSALDYSNLTADVIAVLIDASKLRLALFVP
jgi:hypothetical protein